MAFADFLEKSLGNRVEMVLVSRLSSRCLCKWFGKFFKKEIGKSSRDDFIFTTFFSRPFPKGFGRFPKRSLGNPAEMILFL